MPMRDRMDIVEELFALAAELPPPQRRDLLDRRCAGDDSLRREVEELLACDETMPEGYLGELFARPSPSPIAKPGDVIAGRYELIRELGHGGMGVVFLAEQSEPVRRRVALKLLKAGLDTRQVIARFRAERQALAIMDHPNIARVLHADAAENGRPFFVMELIDGPPLTEHCDRQRNTIRERLGLFLQVCDAVQHAHTKGVIHRDLKPSNVLVVMRDGAPSPRVIDFGIAKATEQRLADTTFQTQRGQLVGTPEYMSPEQAGADPDIDTRTDVYSLGAVLYELLTGCPPFDSETIRSGTLAKAERVICDVDPPKPSTRVSRSGDTDPGRVIAEDNARRRRESPASLAQALRGDLDWIIQKAMEKDRSRRYETVAELAADLRRYLASEPVLARPPSPTYLASRFVRRHRALVTSSAVVALVLLTTGVLTGALAIRESAAHALAERSAQEASRASANSAAVGIFLEEMLTSARSIGQDGANVTMLDVLGATAERLNEGALHDQPDVECRIRRILAKSYLDLGWAPRAVPHLKWASEYLGTRDGAASESALIATWEYAEALKESHTPAAALPLFQRCHDGALTTFGPDDPRTWHMLDDIGNSLMRMRRTSEALPMHERAYQELVRIGGSDDPGAAMPLFNQAGTLRMMRRYADAAPVYERVIELFDRAGADDWASGVRARGELGGVYMELGRLDDAEVTLDETLRLSIERLGPDHGETASTYLRLSRLHWRRARFDDAIPEMEAYVGFLSRVHGGGSLTALQRKAELACLLIGAGELDRAASLLGAAASEMLVADDPVARAETWPGVRRSTVDHAIALRCRALALYQLGRFHEAQRDAQEAFEITLALFPENHRDQLESERVICDILIAQGRAPEILDRAKDLHARAVVSAPEVAARSGVTLAACLEAMGQTDEARRVLGQAPRSEAWRLEVGDWRLPVVRQRR